MSDKRDRDEIARSNDTIIVPATDSESPDFWLVTRSDEELGIHLSELHDLMHALHDLHDLAHEH